MKQKTVLAVLVAAMAVSMMGNAEEAAKAGKF